MAFLIAWMESYRPIDAIDPGPWDVVVGAERQG